MSSSSSGQMRYPATGFATALSGENLLKIIGTKNISWVDLYTAKEVKVFANGIMLNGIYEAPTQKFHYTFSATAETPSFTCGAINSIIISSETEFYIMYSTFLTEKSSW